MEWNAKWDWENLVMFGSRACESPKKLQSTDWGIEEVVDAGSFNLSGGGGGSGGSGSDFGHCSSAKSTISASADSSLKEEMKMSNFTFEAFECFPREFTKNKSGIAELIGASSPLEASVGSGDPLIGLKLGIEDSFSGSNGQTSSFSMIPGSSASTSKKVKSCHSAHTPHCQVEGCNLDLSSAKEYHRKHRVCETHSKSPRVVVGGLERRFCQQCSRFHSLSEFDEKKRSCRRRLSDHNARRRKPPQETIQFNSSRLSSSLYDGRQRMNFLLNNVPLINSKPGTTSTWESQSNHKFTLSKGYLLKPEKAGVIDGQQLLPGIQLSQSISVPNHDVSRLLQSKGTTAEAFSQGPKESMVSFNSDAAPDLRCALSLLSTSSSVSCEPQSSTLDHSLQSNHSNMPQHVIHAMPQCLPLTSSPYWHTEQLSADPFMHALAANSNNCIHFQEIQLFKAPYETGFFTNPLN